MRYNVYSVYVYGINYTEEFAMIENETKPSNEYATLIQEKASAYRDHRANVPGAWKRFTTARDALVPLQCSKCNHRLEGLEHSGC